MMGNQFVKHDKLVTDQPVCRHLRITENNVRTQPCRNLPTLLDSPQIYIAKSETRQFFSQNSTARCLAEL